MLMHDAFFTPSWKQDKLLLISNSYNMFVVQIQRNRASNFKIFAPWNAAELAEPLWENGVCAPQRTENIASGKERKWHGQAWGKDIKHKGSWGTGDGHSHFIILETDMDGEKNGRNSCSYPSKQNQRGSSTPQGRCGRELHCWRAKEQPGHDLDSVGNMTTTGKKEEKKKKRAQGIRLSYHPARLKMPVRAVSM